MSNLRRFAINTRQLGAFFGAVWFVWSPTSVASETFWDLGAQGEYRLGPSDADRGPRGTLSLDFAPGPEVRIGLGARADARGLADPYLRVASIVGESGGSWGFEFRLVPGVSARSAAAARLVTIECVERGWISIWREKVDLEVSGTLAGAVYKEGEGEGRDLGVALSAQLVGRLGSWFSILGGLETAHVHTLGASPLDLEPPASAAYAGARIVRGGLQVQARVWSSLASLSLWEESPGQGLGAGLFVAYTLSGGRN